jgi:hydroxymethylglutaryl-CoA reductase (NADPH)
MKTETLGRIRIPRNHDDDYTEESAAARRAFVKENTGTTLSHVGHYSLDPAILPGNIEHFTGVAQVPIGIAGPLRIEGEHARGDFYVPLATTEGTLISSYNRGMRLLTQCGGVKTTVLDDAMQRAPVFMLGDALQSRNFGEWIEEHIDEIRHTAELTTHVGKLRNIQQFAVGPLRYLRFNFTTGDAAGQNMAGKATFAACEWIKSVHPLHPQYFLTGNTDTDKKHSQLNMLLGRGKRVVAEVVLRSQMLQEVMHISADDIMRTRDIQNAGAFIAGSSNNGAHSANALAALFIATGQDVANIAESHSAITYSRELENGDLYWSITLPSLIVATYGGGTGLATQRECLEMLGCYGLGKVEKFAEICAAVVLAGETSLVAAILHGDWVSAHEKFGRNRP